MGCPARQAVDVWLLDTKMGTLKQLQGMPAFVELKRTSIAWTHDGRLVLLAQADERKVVGMWRPGTGGLAPKAVDFPDRTAGSDSFAPIS
ncbi:MAG: hypothetical protein H0U30_07700 [Actinobacteria bacterium]|nr:hypothetical protein [Actinomycetota bacterium]